MEKDITKTLEDVYYNLKSPASYAGVAKIYKEAKSINNSITKENVKEFLKGEQTYTLHKPLRKHFPRLRTIPSGLHTDWQCDLAVFDSIKKFNDGYIFLLVCIDILSRKIYVAPAKTKKNTDMITAFEKIFKNSVYTPWRLMSDKGTEFNGKVIKNYLEKFGIQKYSMESAPFHSGVVERANRTIKDRLYRYFNQNLTWRWVDIIDKIIDNINNSVNRSIGMTPNEVTFENGALLRKKLYKRPTVIKVPRYKIGDFIRISKDKGVFGKSYLPNYSDEIFKIYMSHRSDPVTYTIEDLNGDLIKGRFYEYELVETTENTRYHIEKILKKRTRKGEKEILVKYKGIPDTVWIKENSLL